MVDVPSGLFRCTGTLPRLERTTHHPIALTSSAQNNRYTYTGREWDSTMSLYHYRARMYNPALGRICSKDQFPVMLFASEIYFEQNYSLTGAMLTGDRASDGICLHCVEGFQRVLTKRECGARAARSIIFRLGDKYPRLPQLQSQAHPNDHGALR